jgi:hypothetical protein
MLSGGWKMSEIKIHSAVSITATLTLSEPELRALDAMAGYGADAFLEVFYEKLGKAYMQPYEVNLRCLFSKIREDVPQALVKIDSTRKLLLSADGYRVTKGT